MTGLRPSLIAVAGLLLLTACTSTTTGRNLDTTSSAGAASSIEATTTSTLPSPIIAPTIPPPTTPVARSDELEFVDGKLLGIAQYSLMSFAADVLGIAPVPVVDAAGRAVINFACYDAPQVWMIQTGGWTLVFEGYSAEEAIVSNWIYVGGPAAGYTAIVAPGGIRIGDSRSAVEAANPDLYDVGNEIWAYSKFVLRYGIESGNVDWFGVIDCLFETEGD